MTQPQALCVSEVQAIYKLAIDVELQLIGRTVPDAGGAGAQVPLEVVEALLAKVRRAVDAVHDLQRWGRAVDVRVIADTRVYPLEKGPRLVPIAKAEQRIDRKRSIPDPCVTVIPVALAADILREAGRH